MTLYPGTRSLDAEIFLNFIEGTVTMDYTLNKFGSPYESNDSTVLSNSEWQSTSTALKIIYSFWLLILLLAGILIGCAMPIITTLFHKGIIKNPKLQYYWQNYLKFYYFNLNGTYQQSHNGKLYDKELIFIIPKNIWFKYDLEGEYKDKIKSISLLRNILTRYKFGRFREERQHGWKIIFEFTDPPKKGSATINYV